MKITHLEALWPKLGTVCGAAAGAVGTALSFLSEVAVQLLGVPLPVVMASAAGAGLARALGEEMAFTRALLMSSVWTVLGCVGAPLVQALIPSLPGLSSAALPPNALAGVAAVVASAPWWWPKVLPAIQARFGVRGGGNG